jgi:pimeloyl-ACP methyl ester carboxylesterase
MWGEADPVIPVRWADRLGENFSHFELGTLPGIGHFTAFEVPDAVIKAVEDVSEGQVHIT